MAQDVYKLAAQAAREVGIPPKLYVALITRGERSYRGWQTSPSGAQGPAQLMPGTADNLAKKYGINPRDYYGNLLGGAYYLKEQLDHFKDPRLAVAAYNAGPGAVSEHGGVPPYAETQRYVKNIMSQMGQVTVPPPGGATTARGSTGQPRAAAAPFVSGMPDLTATLTGNLGKIASGTDKATDLLGPLLEQAMMPRIAPTPAPAQPDVQSAATRGAPARSTIDLSRGGGGWGGSYTPATELAKLGESMGLSVTSEKRDRKMTASGNPSDHWAGSKNAYAYDLGGSPQQMDAAAKRLAAQLGVKYNGRDELVLTKTVNGLRYQILYRTHVGGDHFTHIHVGVRRVG